jgi:hypothetical protein
MLYVLFGCITLDYLVFDGCEIVTDDLGCGKKYASAELGEGVKTRNPRVEARCTLRTVRTIALRRTLRSRTD